jgi:hypothetical protein
MDAVSHSSLREQTKPASLQAVPPEMSDGSAASDSTLYFSGLEEIDAD